MMKTLITLSFTLIALSVQSQVWFELGPRVSYGFTGFYNSNIISDDQHDYQLAGGLSYGGAIGINFGDNHGINLEAMVSESTQTLTFRGDQTLGAFDASWEWEALDAYLLYRFYTDGGAYFEVGPKVSFLSSMTQMAADIEIPTEDAYSDLYVSGVAGVGAFLAGSKVFTLKMGMRLEFGATDLVDDQSDSGLYPAVYTRYNTDAATYPFRASIGLELSFGLGGVAKATCGKRSFMFGGRYK